MKTLNKAASIANRILMVFVLLAASLLFMYGMYVLYDIFYTGKSAFTSYDLLQYRPVQSYDEDGSEKTLGFTELKTINSDTVGWLEMFGTHINYPVVQGEDDLEYLNKDIYGNSTLTGSIYLSAENSSGFDDWYNIIYGHHMDNGAMFGDIDKYRDKDYFDSHRLGMLQTENGTFDLRVFACISTDSYNGTVYNTESGADVHYPELKKYISEHAINISEFPDESKGISIVGLSTCTDAVTNGRIVLFASLEPHDPANDIYADYSGTNEDDAAVSGIRKALKAVGHYSGSAHWAFLNLVSMILTVLTLLPLLSLRKKYRQIGFSRRKAKKLKDKKDTDERIKDLYDDLRSFVWKMRAGIIIELLIAVAAVLIFIFTEDITKRVVISDKYTWIMVVTEAAALAVDFICFRYRGIRPDDEYDENHRIPETQN